MPIVTKRKKVRLPFFTFQIPVGWEAKPLTAAEKKRRKADKEKERQERAEEAQKHLQAHMSRQPAKPEPTQPRPAKPVGAAGYGPAKTRATRSAGNLCGQPTKRGGTCKRVVTNVPCPDHPAGRPKGRK